MKKLKVFLFLLVTFLSINLFSFASVDASFEDAPLAESSLPTNN